MELKFASQRPSFIANVNKKAGNIHITFWRASPRMRFSLNLQISLSFVKELHYSKAFFVDPSSLIGFDLD